MPKSIFLFIPAIFIVLLLAAISSRYQPTPKSAPVVISPIPIPKTTRQTYRNDQYGFEFQYPDNKVVVDKDGKINVGNVDIYLRNKLTTNIYNQVLTDQKDCNRYHEPDKKTYYTTNGIQYYNVCNSYYLETPSKKANEFIELVYYPFDEIQIQDQILSTFKFIDQ